MWACQGKRPFQNRSLACPQEHSIYYYELPWISTHWILVQCSSAAPWVALGVSQWSFWKILVTLFGGICAVHAISPLQIALCMIFGGVTITTWSQIISESHGACTESYLGSIALESHSRTKFRRAMRLSLPMRFESWASMGELAWNAILGKSQAQDFNPQEMLCGLYLVQLKTGPSASKSSKHWTKCFSQYTKELMRLSLLGFGLPKTYHSFLAFLLSFEIGATITFLSCHCSLKQVTCLISDSQLKEAYVRMSLLLSSIISDLNEALHLALLRGC